MEDSVACALRRRAGERLQSDRRVRHNDVSFALTAVHGIAPGRPMPPVRRDESAQNRVDHVLRGFGAAASRDRRKHRRKRGLQMRKACLHKRSETPELARPHVAGAPLVLDDSIEPEEANGGSVRVHFNLEASRLPGLHFGAMAETGSLQEAAEGDHIRRKRPAQIRGMAAGVETPKVPVKIAFGLADTLLIGYDQGRIDRDKGIIFAGLRRYPVQDLAGIFQSGRLAKMQFGADQGRG